jgi:tetratricopeptide (TPR) repeat protein
MPEPVHVSLRSSQTIALIESSPLDPVSWEKLAEQVRGQNDPLSTKSLEIIIRGLRKVEEINERAAKAKTPLLRPSGLGQAMFVRLAKAYNSPTLLKEAGLIYLRDFNLPEVSLEHFERSVQLGAPEKELRPLIDAAKGSMQRQAQGQDGKLNGVTAAPHAKSEAATIIRKTGKMLLPARFGHAATTRVAEPESETNRPVPTDTAECLAEAETAVQKGLLGRAEVLLRQADRKPIGAIEMWQGWTNLGQAHYERGNFVEVEVAFVQALKYDPGEMASHFNVALGYHLNQKFDRAVAAYLKANELEPKHPKVWCNLGVLYFQTDAYEQAEAALRTAVEAKPDYARAWDNLAAALGAQDKLNEAIEACRKAVALRPDYPEAYFKLGVIYFTNGRLEQAADEFRRASVMPDLSAYCDAFLAMVQARLDRPEPAEAAVRKAALADPKCDLLWMAWNEVGLSWFIRKKYADAARAYEEATRLKPDESETWFNFGVSQHQAGDLKAARAAYQHAVELKEALAGAWHNLGLICAQENELAAAMTAFRQETRWDPENAQGWRELGAVLGKLGREDEAQEILAKAREMSEAAAKDPRSGARGAGSAGEPSKVSLPPGLDIRLPAKAGAGSP